MWYETTCPICEKKHGLEVPDEVFEKHKKGMCIQYAWPEADSTTREIIISGMCPECQDKIFSEEEQI